MKMFKHHTSLGQLLRDRVQIHWQQDYCNTFGSFSSFSKRRRGRKIVAISGSLSSTGFAITSALNLIHAHRGFLILKLCELPFIDSSCDSATFSEVSAGFRRLAR